MDEVQILADTPESVIQTKSPMRDVPSHFPSNTWKMLSDDDKLKLSNLIGTRISDEAWKLMNKTKRQRKCKKRNKLFDNLEDDQKRWIASVKSVASQSV